MHPGWSASAPRSDSSSVGTGVAVLKFQTILSDLIAQSPYSRNRRPIWEYAGITSAALSQYLSGRTRPRLETLCLLADFFGVTLDYLILGRTAQRDPGDEREAMARYVDWTLADVQARTGAHTWLVTRIGQVIAAEIDDAARRVLPEVSQVGGIVTDNDALQLERFSVRSKILTINLEYDLLEMSESVFAGRFARVVAENLCKPSSGGYQFLLPSRADRAWGPMVHSYRKVLSGLAVPPEQMKHCQFRRTDAPVFSGGSFHQLDLVPFSREDPLLFEALKPFMSDEGWVGFTLHQINDRLAGLFYDVPSLRWALDAFDGLWDGSSSAFGD